LKSNPHFRHISTVFAKIAFSRKPDIPETVSVSLNIQIKIVDNASLPQRLQVNLRTQTNDDADGVNLQIEAIGLFDYVGTDAAPTKQEKIDFLRERGLHIVWQSIAHMTIITTAEMGMSPLKLFTPDDFGIEPLEQKYLAGDQSTSE
jgi:hypothetical protein